MNNYRNNRKNRFKSNGDRNFRKRSLNGHKTKIEFNSSSEFRHRSPGRNNQNAAKLVEKYNNLAREALSTGDKILSENYFQHADHFMRIIEDKNKNFASNKAEETKKIETEEKNTANDQIADSENINKENK